MKIGTPDKKASVALVGGGWQLLINRSGSIIATNRGQDLAGREPQSLKYITANLFRHNCMLPEYYMCLLASHKYKHPTIISTHSGS